MTAPRKALDLDLAAGIGRDHGVRASLRDRYGTSSAPVPVPTDVEVRRALGTTYDLASKDDRPALIAAFHDGWHQARRLLGQPVGIVEIADRLSVQRATVDQWLQRDLLPEPDWTVGGRPAWNWSTIHRWAAQTKRYQEEVMVTLAELTLDLGLPPSDVGHVGRWVGTFEPHDPRTGRLSKPWTGTGMAATFSRDEADQLIAEWNLNAMSAERVRWLTYGTDTEANELAERYRV